MDWLISTAVTHAAFLAIGIVTLPVPHPNSKTLSFTDIFDKRNSSSVSVNTRSFRCASNVESAPKMRSSYSAAISSYVFVTSLTDDSGLYILQYLHKIALRSKQCSQTVLPHDSQQ